MQNDLWQRRIGWLAVVAIILASGAMAQSNLVAADDPNPPRPAPPPPPSMAENILRGLPGTTPQDLQQALNLVRQTQSLMGGETGKYWIGVECREAPPELMAQLGLKEGEGLVVVHLMEDGAGAKAGLKQHDLILSAGDTALSHGADLIKAVNAAEGKEISLKVMRAGKQQTITITPAERPQENWRVFTRPGPGMMFSGGPPPRIPDNMTISIVRHGGNPAKIAITRGDEKWDVTENELDKLPEDVRPIVQGTLGGGPMSIQMPGGLKMNWQGMQNGAQWPLGQANPPAPPGAFRMGREDGRGGPPADEPRRRGPPDSNAREGGPGPDLMRRLDELDRRLEELQNELRGFRDGARPPRAGDNGPPPDADRRGPPPEGDRRGPPPGGPRQGPPGE